ncbi:hypothetical protein SCACP_30400 [Sporomusa carbonis]
MNMDVFSWIWPVPVKGQQGLWNWDEGGKVD